MSCLLRRSHTVPLLALATLLLAACRPPAPEATTTAATATLGTIERTDPRLDALVPADARLEVLADGFVWSEGPAWSRADGAVLFSDVPRNTIYRWKAGEGLGVFLRPAGFTGPEAPGDELGSNGLAFDAQGRLALCDHGNRAVARLDTATFTKTILADRYEGRRLNSPNDLVYHTSGALYFTDPPYGLRGLNESPLKELPFNGVYRLAPDGTLTLLTDTLTFPNGIALSPDEQTLYVAVSDPAHPVIMAYDVQADGRIAHGRVFFDAAPLAAEGKKGLPDGMAVDQQGNLFATGPGGVLVISPEGTLLGTLNTGEATANCAFGDDGATLYVTADRYLARIRLSTKGLGF